MKELRFKKIDAFTDGRSSGNPAAAVYLEKDQTLTEAEMQMVAQEQKGYVNEVCFVSRVGEEFNLRFYSSECEVAFCGHATVAVMHDILKNAPDLVDKKEAYINVSAGKLPVFNHVPDEDAVYIAAPAPKFMDCDLTRTQIGAILGAEESDLDTTRPIRLIDGGLRTLHVPLTSLEACLKLFPDQGQLRRFCLDNHLDIIHVFTDRTSRPDCTYRTRVFAPRFGYLEDPATGSGNAAFGYYLIDRGDWPGDLTIEQGPDRDAPNLVRLKMLAGRENMLFGGGGATRLAGTYFLHPVG